MIPEGWRREDLSKLFVSSGYCKDGDWIESKDQDPNGDVRLIQLADIGDGCFINKSRKFLSTAKANNLKCTFIETGNILVARMPEPLGRACIFPGLDCRAVAAVDVCILKPDEQIDTYWLMFFINSPFFRRDICARSFGTTRIRISRKNLISLEVVLPPLSEQKRIAEILSSVDDAILATEKVIEQSKKLKKGLMQELLTKGIGHTKFKKTEIGEIPEEWRKVKCDEITSFLSRGKAPKYSDKNSGVLVINQKCVRNGRVEGLHARLHDSSKKQINENIFLKQFDICINSTGTGTIGRAGIWRQIDGNKYFADTHITIFRLISSEALPDFVNQVFQHGVVQKRLAAECFSGSTNQMELSKIALAKFSILLPPLSEQKRIVEILNCVDEKIIAGEKFVEQSKKLKSGLMQDLLTGRVRVATKL